MAKGYKDMLAEANAEVVAITPETARPLLGSDKVIFVDLREAAERERDGAIPGAKSVPRGMLEFWLDPQSPYHKPFFASGSSFVFFCAGGLRSALAAKTAQDMGLTDVKHIEGGYAAWKQAGLPTEVGVKAR